MGETRYLLEVEKVSKAFPGVKALQDVDFNLKPGEVHALVGENGAGKSTLIKIISGVYSKDQGTLKIRDVVENIVDPHHARRLGVGVIFQEFSLIPGLTVAENVFLANEQVKSRVILDRKTMFEKTQEIFDKYGIELDPRENVEDLSTARQQLTEITKALSLQPDIIIMDEPTSSLTDAETKILFKIIGDLKRNGVGIIYVSHRMDEIFQIADRVGVLRDGIMVDDVPIGELNLDKVVKMMVGREVELYESSSKPRESIEKLPARFEVRDMSSDGKFSAVSFQVKKGEILGVAGLVGSGRSEVMRAVFGVDSFEQGKILLEGREVRITSVRNAIDLGIALLPESRKLQGLVLMHNLVDNITLPILRRFLTRMRLLVHKNRREYTSTQVDEFDIRPGDIRMILENLSGGNQQKVSIAKWLSTNPKLLIVDEPTVGIDVRTKSEIHRLLRRLTEEGVSVIMISSEMQELLAHSDRVMVMNRGKVLGTFYNEDISQEKIMSLIMEDIMQKQGVAT
jgi:ABC-type sugar transport system ATPase subunit